MLTPITNENFEREKSLSETQTKRGYNLKFPAAVNASSLIPINMRLLCYLSPNTSEHTLPLRSSPQPDRLQVLDLPTPEG